MAMLRSLLLLLACATTAAADDWAQWLGPARSGVSTEKIAPWKEPPKVLWKLAVAEGHSSPIVADGRAFLHVRVKGKDEEEVIACNATTGAELWRQTYPRAPFKSPFASAGVDGTATSRPGTWRNIASSECEWVGPSWWPAPCGMRTTNGTRTWPPNM